jgi:hypothetical protein
MQKLESKIMINGVFRYLAINCNGDFAIPLHDAIYCERSISEDVKMLIEEEIKKEIGVEATVRIK